MTQQQEHNSAQHATPTPSFTGPHGRAKTLALTGLFLSMAVSTLSMSVIGTSLPIIIADIGGDQAAFTWVITATMLASAITTPIWGKLADLTSKKALLQVSIIIFVLGSAASGLAQDPVWLITSRVFQGIGVGGLGALGQIVLAEIISPRERGKYMGAMSAIMSVSIVGGPLLGGWITDAIGWRWNFYVAVPIALVAIIFLQRTLHLYTEKRKVSIDYWGAAFISTGFSSLLVWVTLGGSAFEWWSWETLIMVGGGLAALGAAVCVELRVDEPLIPLSLFKNRTFTLSVIASFAVGITMFGTAVFLGQYMQLARDKTPTEAGLLTIPMMAGVLISSTLAGQLITRTGKWKRYPVTGSILILVGLLTMGQMRHDTSLWYVGISTFILGTGIGLCIQNLVMLVQNTVDPSHIGAASATVTFFRIIGGTAGMSAMGAMLAHQVSVYTQQGLAELAQTNPEALDGADALTSGVIPKLAELSEPLRLITEQAYGQASGNIFLATAPAALVAIITIALLPNIPLGTLSNSQMLAERRAAAEAAAAAAAAQPAENNGDAEAAESAAHTETSKSTRPTGYGTDNETESSEDRHRD